MKMAEQIELSVKSLRLAIVADDLIGALDAAPPFPNRGLAVRVATRAEVLGQALAGAEVVAGSTRSHNIAAELAAFPEGPVLAVPALPEFGRVVRGGNRLRRDRANSHGGARIVTKSGGFGDAGTLLRLAGEMGK